MDGRLVVVRLLLENGAQVGRENEDGWTALHFAVSQGHKAVTRLSLDRGADPWSVDVENVWNWTADLEISLLVFTSMPGCCNSGSNISRMARLLTGQSGLPSIKEKDST